MKYARLEKMPAILTGTYLAMDCPSCGRRRLEWHENGDIVCEICGVNHSRKGEES